jgi:hypothetical protein
LKATANEILELNHFCLKIGSRHLLYSNLVGFELKLKLEKHEQLEASLEFEPTATTT